MNEFECVDEAAFLDTKFSVFVTSSSKANGSIVGLFPVL